MLASQNRRLNSRYDRLGTNGRLSHCWPSTHDSTRRGDSRATWIARWPLLRIATTLSDCSGAAVGSALTGVDGRLARDTLRRSTPNSPEISAVRTVVWSRRVKCAASLAVAPDEPCSGACGLGQFDGAVPAQTAPTASVSPLWVIVARIPSTTALFTTIAPALEHSNGSGVASANDSASSPTRGERPRAGPTRSRQNN